MVNNDNKIIANIVDEAARLLRDNPDWTYKQAIDKAKELIIR